MYLLRLYWIVEITNSNRGEGYEPSMANRYPFKFS